jgi:hypothetical protein
MTERSIDRPANVPAHPFKRRGLLVGAGVAGVAALAVKALPGGGPSPLAATASGATAPDLGGGYQLTDHVKRYYQTARS